MPIRDPNLDAAYQKMVEAYEGDTRVWRRVNEALRDALVDFAVRRSPYYRRTIRRGRPFDAIPILTKGIVREHADDLLAEGIPSHRRVRDATSGSSGEPMAFYRDSAQGPLEYVSAERFLRHLQAIPPEATMVWVAAHPVALPGQAGDRAGRARRALRALLGRTRPPSLHPVSTYGLTRARLARELTRWEGLPSYFLYGHASMMDWIADQLERPGLRLRRPPSCVVTTSDTLTELARVRIARAFRCPVHSWYGSRELNGYLAGTVPDTGRYVFNPLLAHVELLDDSGRPVGAGETGRLVLTDLNNYVMPFIRYDSEDLAVESADRYIGGFRVVEAIAGRSAELLRLPSGRVINAVTLTARLFVENDFTGAIRFYQSAQTGPNELELRVVWTEPQAEERASEVAAALRPIVDPDTVIRVETVDRLERLPSGKAWVIRGLDQGRA